MADYSIVHERVLLVIFINKNVELWVYVAHQILQQSTCVKLYECIQFGTNIVGEMCTNSVT